MGNHIRAAQSDPLLGLALRHAVGSSPDTLASIWWWIKHRVKFVHHDVQICQVIGQCQGGLEYQLLVTPPVLLRMSKPAGDCATFTMLALAMAMAAGCRVRIATLACDRQRPGDYSHVYGAVMLDSGEWCPFDVSHGKYPGWEVPQYDQQRKTIWDLDANVISDEWFKAAA
jgi:Transglutaminase-like superfamily